MEGGGPDDEFQAEALAEGVAMQEEQTEEDPGSKRTRSRKPTAWCAAAFARPRRGAARSG
jgi:hypothetical protein